MAKPAEKQEAKLPAKSEANGVRKPSGSGKKPPPAKPLLIRKGL